jgi:DNA helicase-2/ATP-dependent DNA helicase PcrA
MSPNVVTELRPAYLDAADELRPNPGQWKAYESKGNCVILAGPGSGKTKVLTVKMARLLAEDVSAPRGIACLTFNTECVRELERRLDRLGVRQGPNVFIGTVHSFCLKHVLLPFGGLANMQLPSPFRVATVSETRRIFEIALAREISADEPPSRWRTRFESYRRTYFNRDRPQWKEADEQVANLIERYEGILHEEGLIDFDDMVLVGLRAIEGYEWVRSSLRAKFPILVVDEYQDLGVPLHQIVLNLCFRADVRLVAVGDPDQSIYGFTGANPELLKELSKRQNVEAVPLRFNYRSGKTIVKAAEAALGEQRDYEAKGSYEGTIDFYECPNGIEEQADLICASIIPEALDRRPGRTLGDVAVLYLDRNDGNVIADAAKQHNFKFIRIDQGAPYQKTPLTRWLEDCAAWCSGGWKRGSPRLSNLTRAWLGFNRNSQTAAERRSLQLSLANFLFAHREGGTPLGTWLNEFYGDCLKQTLDRDPLLRDEEDSFRKLAGACAKGEKLEDFTITHFGGQGGSPDHLNLITLHSAKGLEFDVVILMGMEQGRIPSWAANSPESKREPRRLFYVGLTRARHEVHMTYSGWRVNPFGRRFENGPSEFLLEVKNKLQP